MEMMHYNGGNAILYCIFLFALPIGHEFDLIVFTSSIILDKVQNKAFQFIVILISTINLHLKPSLSIMTITFPLPSTICNEKTWTQDYHWNNKEKKNVEVLF